MEDELETLETTIEIGNETIEIWRGGVDDYWVNYINMECSVRGTLAQIISQIAEDFGPEALLNW